MHMKKPFASLRRDDEGVALVAVIGLMAVGLLLSSLILGSVVNGVAFTSSTRAGVQSQASAEAGVAQALAGLRAGTCAAKSGVYQSAPGVFPQYKAVVWSQSSGGTWAPGCPQTGTLAIKILSDGTAQARGAGGQSGNDVSAVEAIFATTPTTITVPATGPAVYAYSSQGFGGGGQLLTLDGSNANIMVNTGSVICDGGAGLQGDVVILNGNLTLSNSCNVKGNIWVSGNVTVSGGLTVGGDIVAGGTLVHTSSGTVGGGLYAGGSVTVSGGGLIKKGITSGGTTSISSRTVDGDVWSIGNVTLGSTTIGGNVTSGGKVTPTSSKIGKSVWANGDYVTNGGVKVGEGVSATLINLTNSGDTIGTTAWSSSSVQMTWSVKINNIVAKSLTTGGGTWTGGAFIDGTATATEWTTIPGSIRARVLNANNVTFQGGKTVLPNGPINGSTPPSPPARPVTPTAPGVPTWVDFKYDLSQWSGYAVKTLSGTCTFQQIMTAVDSFAATSTTPARKGLLDARGCTNGFSLLNDQPRITLSDDLVIFANKFDIQTSTKFQSTVQHKLWLITPDEVANGVPNCPAGGSFYLGGGMSFQQTVDVMVYTPCAISISTSTPWRGQIFGSTVSVSGATQLTFVATGLPGVDLSTGLTSTIPSTAPTWTLASTRNVAVGG